LIIKKKMMFQHLTVVALLVNSAMLLGVSAKTNTPLSDKDMLLQMQERIEYLENAVGVIADSTAPAADGDSVPLRASSRHKTRGGIRTETASRRRLSKKSGKKGDDSSKFCYSDNTELGVFEINEFPTLDGESAIMQLGAISIKKGESIKIEVSATTLLVIAKGGSVDPTGIQVHAVGGGVIMRPLIWKCDDLSSSCDDDDDCLDTSCRGSANLIPESAIKPTARLPVDVTVFGGYTNYDDGDRRSLQDFWYEIEGQLDYSTTTGKFFIPSHELGKGDYLVDFVFSVGQAGINIDIEDLGVPDWTLAGASLGPHTVEVTKTKTDHEECELFEFDDDLSIFEFFPEGGGGRD
jgi:hypothetical protein